MEQLQIRPTPSTSHQVDQSYQQTVEVLAEAAKVESELFELGQERLFSGARSNAIASSSRIVAPALVELTSSLDVAKAAFCCALNRLLHQSFEESRVNSPAVTPGVLETSSVESIGMNPFLDSPIRSNHVGKIINPYPQLLSVPPDLLLPTLLASLRLETKDSIGSSVGVELEQQESEVMIEELKSRIARIAVTLTPTDAALAEALGSLLGCIERLRFISSHTASPTISNQEPIQQEVTSDVYATLLLQAKELQSNRNQWSREATELVVGVAREVELAESDCLWGRVDDLSESVRVLCRTRADSYVLGEENGFNPFLDLNKIRDSIPDGISDLPRYSTDLSRGLPPEYFEEIETGNHSREKSISSLGSESEKLITTGQSSNAMYNEKMQRDLESVSSAIERLYQVSPQLANQRVEPDRRKLRERQLAKLGNAIERLSIGRLDDQRAIATPIPDEDPIEKEERLKRKEDVALDKLIAQIDRAASRTLADQRAVINGKMKQFLRSGSDETVKPTAIDLDFTEADRRAHILDSIGKGRLSSQDASFSPLHTPALSTNLEFTNPFGSTNSSTTLSQFFLSEEETLLNNDKVRKTSLTNSERIPIAMRKRFSSIGLFQNLKKGTSSPSSSRRGSAEVGLPISYSMSRSNSINFEYIAEASNNLGTITVTFWPTQSTSTGGESYSVLSIESNTISILISTGGSFKILLPSPIIENQEINFISRGSHFEFKVIKLDNASSTASQNGFTDIQSPLSTQELRNHLPTQFSCVNCRNVIVKSDSIIKYNALPSEHWVEMLDSWMCHGDQELSQDLIKKGNGIKPRIGEGLVGASYILFEVDCTRGWKGKDDDEGRRTDTDDLLTSAYCLECDSLIGFKVVSILPDPTPTIYFRLLKYASFPTPITKSKIIDFSDEKEEMLRSYNLSTHITAELLQIGQSHACHRFIIEDVETERAQLLLWVFNPSLRISYSQPDSSYDSTFSNTSIHASKIFYSIVEKESDPICQEFISADSFTIERIGYPLNVIRKLRKVLELSNERYAIGNRTFGLSGDMSVGFLERI